MLDRFTQTILESADLIPLPALPQVLVRFLALLEDEHTPMKDLATLVARTGCGSACDRFLACRGTGRRAKSRCIGGQNTD